LIFTTFSYFLFLVPAAVLFRVSGSSVRAWILTASGIAFFVYFSVTEFAGWIGAACVLIFVWEALVSRL
jgi:alginate O-acetyltransferase complex protein AlgI